MENAEEESVRPTERFLVGEESTGGTGRPGTVPWPVLVLSVLLSAMTVVAVGCLCALTYPIVKELRAERVKGQNGTEEKTLGFWSISVLSVLVGCMFAVFSWTLTYLDSYQSGMVFPAPLIPSHFRDESGCGFLMGYGVTILNGIMAMITVIWSLN